MQTKSSAFAIGLTTVCLSLAACEGENDASTEGEGQTRAGSTSEQDEPGPTSSVTASETVPTSRAGTDRRLGIEPDERAGSETAPGDRESESELKAGKVDIPEGYADQMREAGERARAGDGDEALALFEAAATSRPDVAKPRTETARVLLDLGRAGEAREHAERGVELDESSSLAWNTLGRVELGEGDLEAAAAAFREAAAKNDDNSYAWNNLGYTLLKLESYDEATDALEVATSGISPEPYMWNNLGMAYEHQGDLDRAGAAYRQAKNLGSTKAVANYDRLAEAGVDLAQAEALGEADSDGAKGAGGADETDPEPSRDELDESDPKVGEPAV